MVFFDILEQKSYFVLHYVLMTPPPFFYFKRKKKPPSYLKKTNSSKLACQRINVKVFAVAPLCLWKNSGNCLDFFFLEKPLFYSGKNTIVKAIVLYIFGNWITHETIASFGNKKL